MSTFKIYSLNHFQICTICYQAILSWWETDGMVSKEEKSLISGFPEKNHFWFSRKNGGLDWVWGLRQYGHIFLRNWLVSLFAVHIYLFYLLIRAVCRHTRPCLLQTHSYSSLGHPFRHLIIATSTAAKGSASPICLCSSQYLQRY